MANRNTPIAFLCTYGTSLTTAQEVQENADWTTFLNEMQRNSNPTKNFVLDGNSHTVYWLGKLMRRIQWNTIGQGWKYTDTGISGQTTSSMNTNAPANIDILYSASFSKNILAAWEATNDISVGTAIATVESNYSTYCSGRRTAGFKVIAMPAMSRDYAGDTTKILNTDLFNSWLLANWATFADAYCPHPNANYFIPRSSYASDAAYVTAVQALTNNAIYFSDGDTHLTEFGYEEWGDALTPIMLSL